MERKNGFLPAFLVAVFLGIVILFFSVSGNLKSLSSFLEKETSKIQSVAFGIFQKLPFISQDDRIKKLEDENLELMSQISAFEKLKRENAALSDQFQTAYPQATRLLKADIVGASAFIPGVSVPNSFVINKGLKDNLKVGMAVVIKDNLIGSISKISTNLSEVAIITNPSFSFTAKTQNGAVGIIKGAGGIILDNILLSENITTDELVLTKGEINGNGIGIPPDLVVGKITSVEKKPSELFQKAKVESFVNFVNLSTVFVYTQTK